MPTTLRVPSLHDRHSHASLYAAFGGCPSLAGMDSHGALEVLRRLNPEHLSIVFGWHSARAPLTEADLCDLPPVVIVNVSLHGFVLTAAAADRLADIQPELVRHGHDALWIEGHLPQVVEFFGRTAELTPQKLETFMSQVGTVDQVITAVERLDRDGVRFPGIRLEHAQLIDRAQAERARDVGIVLSMQPNFNSDSRDYADRLDESLLAANNPFRMLIDEVGFRPGRDLIFGSDGMPHGIEYALQWSLFPAYPGQRLSVDELVAGYGVHPGDGTDTVLDVDAIGQCVTLAQG